MYYQPTGEEAKAQHWIIGQSTKKIKGATALIQCCCFFTYWLFKVQATVSHNVAANFIRGKQPCLH